MARGFASRSYEINSSIKRLRDQFPQEKFDFEFCFVPGNMNPADKPSRGQADANAKHGTNADIDNLRRLAGEYGVSRYPASSSIS